MWLGSSSVTLAADKMILKIQTYKKYRLVILNGYKRLEATELEQGTGWFRVEQ